MRLQTAAAIFLPLAVLATCLCGLIYVVVQQDLRTGANEPQEQLAEDAAAQLQKGATPQSVVAGPAVDLAVSLAPFIVVFGPNGTVLATNGQLDGQPPMIPPGVLESAHASGIDKVTWQPRPRVRIATVSVPWRGGTVTAGRSLRVVEEQEAALELLVGAGWLATLGALAISSVVSAWILGRGRMPTPA
jgi:hypothetical protein